MSAPGLTVVCAGDAFITAQALATGVTAVFGPDTVIRIHSSGWPDEPFGEVGGVREAVGDVAGLSALLPGADVLITHLAPITAGVIAAAGRLAVIGSTRGGPVNVDLLAATGAGVPVGFLPGRNVGAVAEFTLGTMIAVTRNMLAGALGMAAGRWEGRFYRAELVGPELGDATVGLVGCGAVGRRVAALLRACGAEVLGHDPFVDAPTMRAQGIEPVQLPELLARSDIVSLHARLTGATVGLVGPDFLAAMRPGGVLVNTARGALVDTDALVAALRSGHLAGAALDVHDPEPLPPDHPLRRLPTVLATPHLAGASRTVAQQSVRRVVAAVAGYLADGSLPDCANPEVFGGAVRPRPEFGSISGSAPAPG